MSGSSDQVKELAGRVREITGLNERACQVVATSLLDYSEDPDPQMPASGHVWSAAQIVREAEELGYEFDRPAPAAPKHPDVGKLITADEAEVLKGVYDNCPRVLCEHMPKLGKAPDELREIAPELAEQLPEEVRAMLVKIDLFEGKATFWLRDEANSIDRPIGPIDLTRFDSERAIFDAFVTLTKRLDGVLAADFN